MTTRILKLVLILGFVINSEVVYAITIPDPTGYTNVVVGLDANIGFPLVSPGTFIGDCRLVGGCFDNSDSTSPIVGAYDVEFALESRPSVMASCTGVCASTNMEIMGSAQYYFTISGTDTIEIPVQMFGSMTLNASGFAHSRGMVGASGFSNIYYDCYSSNNIITGCGHFNFFENAMLVTNQVYWVNMVAYATSGYNTGLLYSLVDGSSSSWVDPYFSLDETWAANHPGYSITVSNGIGNSPPQSNGVPEPGTLALVGLALVGMAGMHRRKIW
jgi:hypothetical protein